MTDIIDRADSGDIHRVPGESTEWLNPHFAAIPWPVLRRQIDTTAEIRMPRTIGIHGPYRQSGVVYGPRPADSWIFDVFGEMQEPPTGNPPKLPPPPPQPTSERPLDFRPAHRRHLDRLVKGVLIGASVVTAGILGVDLAAWLVLGWLR